MKASAKNHDLAALLSGRNFGTHRIGCWAGPRTSLNGCEKRKILAAARLKDSSLLQTTRGQHCVGELYILLR